MDSLAARLRELRRERGLPQWALAADAGTHQRHISDYETGRVTPTPLTLRRLAAALEVPVARLVEDEE